MTNYENLGTAAPVGSYASGDATQHLMPMELQKTLSPMAIQALSKMDANQQATFVHMYDQKKKSVGAMLALAILFPIQLFLLDKSGLGVAFILTGGGVFVWYFIEWFLTPGRVRAYNQDVANQILLQMRALA